MSLTSPRECMITTPAPAAGAECGPWPGSILQPDTSLITAAPASSAAAATAALTVSTEIGTSGHACAKRPDDGQDSPLFFVRRDGGCALRSGRFTADIEQVGAFGDQLTRVLDRGVDRKKLTPVAEAVGGNVDDSKNHRPSEGHDAAAHPPGHGAATSGPAGDRPHAGATSGPPRSGGDRRGSATGSGRDRRRGGDRRNGGTAAGASRRA